MAHYKNDPANTGYDAGDLFNYEVWTADTQLLLCNVPWDANYKDVAFFETTNALNEYLEERGDSTTISNAMYARVDEPVSIDMPLAKAQQFNYIRVFNPAQPVAGDLPKYYYYFILGVRHVAPNTTEIVVQLDVWQTYIRQVEFGRAYVERGHIGIANEANFRNFGRDFLTIPEGLDIGSGYVNVVTKREKVMEPYMGAFTILAISTVDLHGDHGNEAAPKQPAAKGTTIQGVPSGAAGYVWTSATDFMGFLADYSRKPWITAGITSITLLPHYTRYDWTPLSGFKNAATRSYPADKFFGVGSAKRMNLFPNWRESSDIVNYIPQRYRHLKKLFTAPYCMVEMTVNSGSAISLRPEAWNSKDATILEKIAVVPPAQRIGFIPMNYNGRNATPSGNMTEEQRRDGDYLDMALFLSAFPTVPIVNNGQIQYLASNARSIAAQRSSLDWSQQRALRGNDVSFDQASRSMDAARQQSANSIQADQTQTAIANELASQQALFNALGGTASGAGMGAFAGPAGAVAGAVGGTASGVMGAIGTGMQIDAANKALAARSATAGRSTDIQQGLSGYLRDSNKSLADWAARGDYANARAALDAKVQDAELIPHGMSGQFGGETFNFVNAEMDVTLKFKMIDQASISIVGEYWLRYGYPVRRSTRIPHDLRVMSKFSYWKLSEIYLLTAGMPETFKQAVRGILEKGVTVWSNPDDIGVIDFADNQPLPGIVIEGYEPPPWTPEPDPEPPVKTKRKKRNMLVFATNDGGMKWALAGSSPGTSANWIETTSEVQANSFLEACGVEEPVLLDITAFYEMEVKYLEPVVTTPYDEGESEA